MRREELLLRDMLESADHVARFIRGMDRQGFQESELVRSAVVQKLTQIGEAAAHVSAALQTRYPEVPWPRIVSFRNILVHAYFGIDWQQVWIAASKESPSLRAQIESILQAEFGN
jgi:uncharacterized protein with HEPN domain